MSGWLTKPLSSVAEVRYGTRVVRKKDGGSLFPVYGGGGVTFSVDEFNRENCFIVSRFGMSAECVRYVSGRFFLNDSGLTVHTTTDEVLQEFLDRFLIAKQTEIYALSRGTAQRNLDMTFFRLLPVSYPRSLEEQRRIVAVLDEAFAAIATATANAEKNLANARELFAGYLESRFAEARVRVKTASLEELCVADRVITYGVIKLGEHVPDGIPCLRTSNVRWLNVDSAGMKFIKPALSKEYSRTILRGGEVLVNVRGTLGGVAVVNESMAGWNVSREVAVVPCDQSRIDPQFLAYWIGTRISQGWLAHVEKGVAYTGINICDLRSLPVPNLPIEEQRRIVAELDSCLSLARGLEASFQGKIATLHNLKQSVLCRAFSGELAAREPLAA